MPFELSERQQQTVAVAITLLAFLLIRLMEDETIYGVVSYAWTGLGSTFGPALILALWWRRASGVGVIAGMVTGVSFTILWNKLPEGGFFETLAWVDIKIAPFVASLAAVVLGSLLCPPRETTRHVELPRALTRGVDGDRRERGGST